MEINFWRVKENECQELSENGFAGVIHGYSDLIPQEDPEDEPVPQVGFFFRLNREGWREAYRLARLGARALGERPRVMSYADPFQVSLPA